jgi:hypothetical protein
MYTSQKHEYIGNNMRQQLIRKGLISLKCSNFHKMCKTFKLHLKKKEIQKNVYVETFPSFIKALSSN